MRKTGRADGSFAGRLVRLFGEEEERRAGDRASGLSVRLLGRGVKRPSERESERTDVTPSVRSLARSLGGGGGSEQASERPGVPNVRSRACRLSSQHLGGNADLIPSSVQQLPHKLVQQDRWGCKSKTCLRHRPRT